MMSNLGISMWTFHLYERRPLLIAVDCPFDIMNEHYRKNSLLTLRVQIVSITVNLLFDSM
jgi:hypothetical protein